MIELEKELVQRAIEGAPECNAQTMSLVMIVVRDLCAHLIGSNKINLPITDELSERAHGLNEMMRKLCEPSIRKMVEKGFRPITGTTQCAICNRIIPVDSTEKAVADIIWPKLGNGEVLEADLCHSCTELIAAKSGLSKCVQCGLWSETVRGGKCYGCTTPKDNTNN